MSAVAVIGLGAMGARMARRLLAGGHRVVVWNRSSEKVDPLVEVGAAAASSPADAAGVAEAVITMVSDASALRAVAEGPTGIAAGARDVTVIQMSTVGPAAVRVLASVLPPGSGLLDAPVLGSVSEAESGSLRIFVGGPEPLARRWAPLLSSLGHQRYMGPLGAGSAAKLVANSTLFAVLGGLGEALVLAEALGLSRRAAFEVLADTPLAEQAERRREAVERGSFPARFTLSLARKDAELIAQAAAATGIDLRLAGAARSWLGDADGAGWGDRDYSAILAWILGHRRG